MDRLHAISVELFANEVLAMIFYVIQPVLGMEFSNPNGFLSILNRSENQTREQRDFRIEASSLVKNMLVGPWPSPITFRKSSKDPPKVVVTVRDHLYSKSRYF